MAKKVVTPEMIALLKKTGSQNREESLAAVAELTVAIQSPLRDGVLPGDITSDIFTDIQFQPGVSPEFPLSFLAPGTEKDYVAYTMPNHGRIPDRNIEGDFVMVPMFDTANSIGWSLNYARDARWDIASQALKTYYSGFTAKNNADGWHTLLASVVDRNIVVYDSAASAGQFTKRLVSLAKTVMRRNGGGNSSSVNRRKLTDLYLSPEGNEDIRDWGVDIVDEVTRREIYTAVDGSVNRIFNVNLHDIDELGEGQEFQNYFTNVLGASLESSDLELAIGLDLSNPGIFVRPWLEQPKAFPDPELHRQKLAGVYGWATGGFGSLDNRYAIALSF